MEKKIPSCRSKYFGFFNDTKMVIALKLALTMKPETRVSDIGMVF